MEKRLSPDQVPFVVGDGGLGGTFTKKEVVNNSGTSFQPSGPTGTISAVPGTLLNFTLNDDQEVLLVATGTYDSLTAGEDQMDVGLKIDGVDTFLGQVGARVSGRNIITFTVHKAIQMLAGAHTVEVIVRPLVNIDQLVLNGVDQPTTLTAIYIEPVGAIGALSKQEAINQTATSFTTTNTTPQIIPGTTVTIDIPIAQTVFFTGYATGSENGGVTDGVLGLQVTSPGPTTSDFSGSELIDSSPTAASHGAMVVTRAISLAAGIHTADLTLRSGSGGTAEVINTARGPSVLTAILTAPEQVAILTTTIAPEQVDAGDGGVIGTSGESAQADHQHAVNTALIGDLGPQTVGAGSAGASTTIARGDHVHPMSSAAPADVDKSAAVEGAASTVARSDHKHDVSTATPVTANGTTNSEGSATSLARSDHAHRVELDVQQAGLLVGQRPAINFTGPVIVTDDAGNERVNVAITQITGFISGLVPSNAADTDHDVTLSTGVATSDGGTFLMTLSSPITKQIDAVWAVGNNVGGLFSGATLAADSTFHMFLIRRASDGVIDAGFDDNISATNIPGGWTAFRRVTSVSTNASSNIRNFVATEIGWGSLLVQWTAPLLDLDSTTATTASLVTLNIPGGLKFMARYNSFTDHVGGGNTATYFSDPDTPDLAPSTTAAPLAQLSDGTSVAQISQIETQTNTSSQIRRRSSTAAQTIRISVLGYTDYRR